VICVVFLTNVHELVIQDECTKHARRKDKNFPQLGPASNYTSLSYFWHSCSWLDSPRPTHFQDFVITLRRRLHRATLHKSPASSLVVLKLRGD